MEFNPQSYAPDGTAVFARDDQMLVKFMVHPELSQHKSKLEGTPVHDDCVVIHLIQPGEKEPIIVLATEHHKHRFPRQWENFQKGVEEQGSGTPLSLLFPAEPSTVLMLRNFHVYTIQQLAQLSDTAIGNIPMGRTLVDRARTYMQSASGGQSFHAMQKQIDDLKAMLAERASDEPTNEQKRGPGRPRKEDAA